MNISVYDALRTIFKACCSIATFVFMGMWIHRYLLDRDTTIIENQAFFETENDAMPVLSMCFEQSFDGFNFSEVGDGLSKELYVKHLAGKPMKHFDKRFTGIEYFDVSTNISDYIISHGVYFVNEHVCEAQGTMSHLTACTIHTVFQAFSREQF